MRTVAADDRVENQQSAILESVCLPDQRTFQQHMEEGAITSGSQNAKGKLGKRKISESNAEDKTCTVPFKSKLTLDSRSSHESRIEDRDSILDDYVSILDDCVSILDECVSILDVCVSILVLDSCETRQTGFCLSFE